VRALAPVLGRRLPEGQAKKLDHRHSEIMKEFAAKVSPLPGAAELMRALRKHKIPHAIGTSGKRDDIERPLKTLKISDDTTIVCADDIEEAKPAPDLFVACRKKLGLKASQCFVIGDAVWDVLAARRAGMLAVGLLTGGYGEDELQKAGAYRVYADPLQLNESLQELGLAI
jgi:HAD superfamily hydrolase (TIGR01509 family)